MYPSKKIRELHADTVEHFASLHASHCTPSEMSYLISALLHEWLKTKYSRPSGETRNHRDDDIIALGILEQVKAELIRTVFTPNHMRERMLHGPIGSLDARSLEDVR